MFSLHNIVSQDKICTKMKEIGVKSVLAHNLYTRFIMSIRVDRRHLAILIPMIYFSSINCR